ncbi:MAG TPA: DoxX family protein [Chitinophagaceae bacterium]|nr:DoxX family protein [Chitinophagaceae bacterium]
MKYNKENAWQFLLLIIRIWLGYRLIAASYSSVIDIITSPKERQFFEKWFGEELHFPFPVVMAFLAKGVECLGGILILLGLFTRPAAVLVALTMMIATLTANLGENWVIDGGFTISYCLFALILVVHGSGRYGLDGLRRNRRDFK